MTVHSVTDPAEDATEDKKAKKKRKREAAEGDVPEDVTLSKKEKKKRRKEAEPTSDNAEPEPSASESKPPREKKDKKDKKEKRDKKDKKSKDSSSDPSPSSSATQPVPLSSSSSDIEAFLRKNEITLTIPDGGAIVTPTLSFSQLDVHPKLRAAFDGFKGPTPIQACSWPPMLEGRDVVGIAETGRCVHIPAFLYPYSPHRMRIYPAARR